MRARLMIGSLLLLSACSSPAVAQALPGTTLWENLGDRPGDMVAGIGRFLDRELVASVDRRKSRWKRDNSSSAAYEQLRGKVKEEFADLGEQRLKNIARSVRVYELKQHPATEPRAAHSMGSEGTTPPRLSIVLLPFANIGGDSEQEYFADGVVESLTTDLSRIRGAVVIARNTAFTYKAKLLDVKTIEGVRSKMIENRLSLGNYLLSGDLRDEGKTNKGVNALQDLLREGVTRASDDQLRAALERAREDIFRIHEDVNSGEFELDPQFAIDRINNALKEVR